MRTTDQETGSSRTPSQGGRVPARPRSATGGKPAPARSGPRPSSGTRRSVLQRVKIAFVVASALVLALTGTAWGLYRDVTAGIRTTDVIAGGDDGGAQNILLVGVDSRTDAHGNPLPPEVQEMLHAGDNSGVFNSDTIIVLHVPDGGGAAIAFSIPRDAYVHIPGYGRDKINAAYPATKALKAQELAESGGRDQARIEAEAKQAGRKTLIGTVENLTGLTINHYAEVNLLGFFQLTNAIGGVEVCLREPVDDPLSGAHFPAGPQTISGADALAFVRQRHGLPNGDLSRIRRQQVFLAAVADKILSSGTLTDPGKLGALIDVVQRTLVIDEGWNLLAFAQQATDIAAGNIEFVTIPTDGPSTTPEGAVVQVDRGEVHGFVERKIEEQAAEAAADAEARQQQPPPPPPEIEVIASRYVVEVRNGGEVGGLAGAVSDHMEALGFVAGSVGNTAPTPTSVVRYTGPDGEAARDLAEQLGGIDIARGEDLTRGHLRVVIGADFDPSVVPDRATEPAQPTTTAPPKQPITAAGVPCVY